MEIHEVLLEMMDKGFSISKTGKSFALIKVPTECDPRKLICDNPQSAQITGLASQQEAVGKYLEIKDICFDVEPDIEWNVQVRFNVGLGPQILEMPSVFASSYGPAIEKATKQADLHWQKDPEKKKHGYTQIKVKPKGF